MSEKQNTGSTFISSAKFLGAHSLHHKPTAENKADTAPLRAELYTEAQLKKYAVILAERHVVEQNDEKEGMLKRLSENEIILIDAHDLLTKSVKDKARLSPAGEWLLDNFYLIEEQIYMGKKHLPKGYSKQLPQLVKGSNAGLPRVYDIAVKIIAHSDGRVDMSSLTNFIKSYQSVVPLKIGELWAIPIMLRLALLENLRRLSSQIIRDSKNHQLANYWGNYFNEVAEKQPGSVVIAVADLAKSDPPVESSFVAELSRRLQENSTALGIAITWVEQNLTTNGMSATEFVQYENQQQAADQVSISNSIGSLRFLGGSDWRVFVEDVSFIHKVLQGGHDDVYLQMDFNTRDLYRKAVEKLAKQSKKTEEDVAQMAVRLTNLQGKVAPANHVGYYLIGKGRVIMEQRLELKLTLMERAKILFRKAPLNFYISAIVLLTLFFTLMVMRKASLEIMPGWVIWVLSIVTLIATSQLAMNVINWLATVLSNPQNLPRIDFRKTIPDSSRTIVVIPTMLSSGSAILSLAEALEVRYISNKVKNLSFALLTDFVDAKEEKLPSDESLLRLVIEKIEELNEKYFVADAPKPFMLFHRPRTFNEIDKIWMGFERKRGKLADLNELLRGKSREKFQVIIGDSAYYQQAKYIIALDSDTQLPREVAWKLIGTMAHPLNRPIINEKLNIVTEGYTILQPRVSNTLPGETSSIYQKIHGNEPGTDPYTSAISDVYQDLFAEGSFVGKGIYDIDAFETVMHNRLPENRILSHDLLEGSYVRASLVTDVQLFEEYPSAYVSDTMRRHRWIRGDWQIAAWITPWVPGYNKKREKNPISSLSRWKIFDNLRRSLTPFAYVILLAYGWLFSEHPFLWTILVPAIIYVTPIVNFLLQLFKKPEDVLYYQHVLFAFRGLLDGLIQNSIDLICLPYTAYLNLDAIARTIWRIAVSHKRLLQWTPFNSSAYDEKNLKGIFVRMWIAPFAAVACMVGMQFYFPEAMISASPILASWLIAPFIVWFISKSGKRRDTGLSVNEGIYLRGVARKTWAFFEAIISDENNFLPADNFQEAPVERLARRTSPTNIGLYLLANITASDFGFITLSQVQERCALTLATMENLKRYKGHFYNWYDTGNLQPLIPRYISSVDSGNLMGHLVVLRQTAEEMSDQPIINAQQFCGLADELRLAEAEQSGDAKFTDIINQLEQIGGRKEVTISELYALVQDLKSEISGLTNPASSAPSVALQKPTIWLDKALKHIIEIEKDVLFFFPWLSLADVPAEFPELVIEFLKIPSTIEIAKIEVALLHKIVKAEGETSDKAHQEWLASYRDAITTSAKRSKTFILQWIAIRNQCNAFADMDYDFLYDLTQNLLSIGFNVEENRRDNSFYDQLASESRLASFAAIAMGKLPQDNWFSLGRQLTSVGPLPILLSWSGSMFEYLMPLLVMPNYENTLLDRTYQAVLQKQMDYGRKNNVPWGISESAYNNLDAQLNWQYKAFGIPGIGFKRGLSEELVISPYSTLMGVMVAPEKAYENLKEMDEKGFAGQYGFYEAIDYTANRLQRKEKFKLIPSYMAHHQGMGFLALSYALHDKPMQKRFVEDVQMKSALLLLQEKVPRVTTFYSPKVHIGDTGIKPSGEANMRVITDPNTPVPEVQLLSNGRYNVMVTNSSAGYSRWKDISLSRWRQDATCDDWGTFCYIRDVANDVFWSVGHQPSLKQADFIETVFSQGRAEFRRRDLNMETHTEIVVSPEDDIELRRVHVTNKSRKKRTIEITSYTEVVLAPAAADKAHPAFSNLFIETAIQKNRNAIVCTRRPRNAGETTPVMFHLMKIKNNNTATIKYETDRSKFIGRAHTVHDPQAILETGHMQDTEGAVLDPIMSIQYTVTLEPYETIVADLVYGAADNMETLQFLIDKYQDYSLTSRVLELAWTHSQVILRQINASQAEAQLYTTMVSSIIFANDLMRAKPSVIIKNNRGQSGLWSSSISGDLPIILVQIEDSANISLVRQMLQAYTYWRLKGQSVDLVIWNEDPGGYRQVLQNDIQDLVKGYNVGEIKDSPGGIYVKLADQINNEDRILFETVAHIIVSDKLGTLEEQINRGSIVRKPVPLFSPVKFYAKSKEGIEHDANLVFYNGYGGFTQDGKEYIIETSEKVRTPAPWMNIIANKTFGSIVTESGQMYSWCTNAHSYRLTPWNNDPVSDLKGEAYYIRDEESGLFWSPAALPATGKTLYRTRHGFGYTVIDHLEDGIESSMQIFTHIEEPVKFISFKLKNKSARSRRLSLTGYVEWVLGELRSQNLMHIVTEMDVSTGAVLARNAYNSDFENCVSFFDVDDSERTFTCDRVEFIGRNGTMASPQAMAKAKLSGRKGAGLDPCAALQVQLILAEDEEKEITFRLGTGQNMQEALALIEQFRGNQIAQLSLEEVHQFWNSALGVLQLHTPDPSINILANGWLTYQSLACRVWGRSGFYQSGGAFGYRDQLQDIMSLLFVQPDLARQHILLCASRQFTEGDVQHWWHPPQGRGVRTTCSDDYLWLPFATHKYLSVTGDRGILDETVTYLEGRQLNEGEESSYDLPIKSHKSDTLYQHCVTAINHALKFGRNGLPFIGSGDWNDGMDKVGEHGQGESVWLGFFLYEILEQFANVAEKKNDHAFAEKCLSEAKKLKGNINENAWDGEWYRRAYFDDGTPLGSKVNEECKIDSIAQSWSVLSGAGTEERIEVAMASAYERLVNKDIGILKLFEPPFNKSDINPGYIQGYVPGVRENGGQYTHAAIWLIMAFAKMGNNEKTWELLQMVNPINHGKTKDEAEQYRVEPYVVCADVYAQPLHKGRGGWTWYTGSAGWMYQLITEHFVGFQKHGDTISFKPCLPAAWDEMQVSYQFLDTAYKIILKRSDESVIHVNGKKVEKIDLINSGKDVNVEVWYV